MPYRTDREALEAQRKVLQRELDAIAKVRLGEQAMRDKLRSVEEAIRNAALRRLAIPVVTTPCDVPWDTMQGDARARRCNECKKNVFNLAATTDDEVREMLGVGDAHVRFYERSDGTVLTADCRPYRRGRRLRIAATAVTAAIAGGSVVSIVAALAGGAASLVCAVTSVDQLTINPTLVGHMIRTEGALVPGTLDARTAGEFSFTLAGPGGTALRVHHAALALPETFRDLPGTPITVLVEGELGPTGVFQATRVMPNVTEGYIKGHPGTPTAR
jgi:cytochrome c-type biogenesis protein CcmE